MGNIFTALKKHTSLEIIWVVYMPKKLQPNNLKSNIKIIDIHNYSNALEILNKEKPDVIFAWATHNFIDYAFSLAAKKMNIPVVSGFSRTLSQAATSSFKFNVNLLFEKTVPTDIVEEKQFMKRGRFFLYKYNFLLKTQFAIKMKKFEIIKDFFILLKIYLSNPILPMYSKFENSLHWVSGEELFQVLIDKGFDKSKLVLSGHPMYDQTIKKIKLYEPRIKNQNIINVLFAPGTLAEHGFADKLDQEKTIQDIVKIISTNKNIKLKIKIHPSSAILSDYQKLVNSINPNIPIFQDGDFLDFLNEADVLISFSDSSIIGESLIAKKPVIIVNFTSIDDDIIKRGLAFECKNISSLPKMIDQSLSSNIASEKKMQKFISEFFYKLDGKASERIANSIIKLINKN
jgi:UDP-N-acetylglucosamine:LPS N-acetylglucosamine transferase